MILFKLSRIITLLILTFNSISLLSSKIIAHRGASAYAPENTKASVSLAWKLGASGSEIDVRLTKDKKVIVFHDKNLMRVADISLNIQNSSYDQLKNIDIGSWFSSDYHKERIPLLQDILGLLPKNKLLFIELKDESIEIVDEVLSLLKERPEILDQIVLISFSYKFIDLCKILLPQIRTLYLVSYLGDSKKEHNIKSVSKLKKIINRIKDKKVDGLSIEFSPFLTEDIIKLLKKENILLSLWSYKKDDTLETARYIEPYHFDFITTNYPDFIL